MNATEPRAYTPQAELRDVTLRDGLQLTAQDDAHRTQGDVIRELLCARRADPGDRLDGRGPTSSHLWLTRWTSSRH